MNRQIQVVVVEVDAGALLLEYALVPADREDIGGSDQSMDIQVLDRLYAIRAG